jgi:hypothetical protein
MKLLATFFLLAATGFGQVQGVAGDQPGGPPLPQVNKKVAWIKLIGS